MNRIQSNLLDLFKVLMNYLDENNIPYCAAYGTCLGAVRHKGFIPWDDDIDIYIRREDYNRLLKLITTYNNENYYFGDLNDSKYPYTFLKFYTKNYKIAEMSLLEKYQTYNNLYIDIFPVDYIDESKLKYGKLYRNLMRVKTSVSPSKMKTLFKRVLSFLIPISVNKIKKNINNLGEKIRTEKSLDICWSESIMPTYLLDDLIDVPFEDIMIKVPKDYDNYLKCMFGDYMTLPPVEERVSNHTFKELN